MKKRLLGISILFSILITGTFSINSSYGQFQQGGVDHPGEWYVGEGLKKGDYFSYQLCYVDYKECADFQIDWWIEGDIKVGTEDKWLAKVVVYDGNKIIKGDLELGKIAPEPTGGSSELGPYRSAFKSSIVWLSAFATSYGGEGGEGPKKFSAKSWGKIGNIGGEQVLPTNIESVTVPAGFYDESILISWRTGGYTSKVWIVDGFPFPIKAATWTHVSEGKPPPEYQFQLLEYSENVEENPFKDIIPTDVLQADLGCPQSYDLKKVSKPTNQFNYQVIVRYGPENPIVGCEIEWFIDFLNKFDQTEFLNQVQYDLLVVDENQKPLRSIADDEGRLFLYSPSGQVHISTLVEEDPGIAHYVIWIIGLSPEGIVPSPDQLDFLQIDIPIAGEKISIQEPTIPDWIKTNAGWWSEGLISNNDFVQGIQFLIKEGIMVIPPTSQGSGEGSNEIPDWIKTNAGWWSEGLISDNDFVQGIQFLIKEGIMKISS